MDFLYPFLNFLQPGILWPEIAEFRPMLIAAIIGVLVALPRRCAYLRQAAFANPIFFWLSAFFCAQILSVFYSGFNALFGELLDLMVYPLFVVISILLISNAMALKRYIWGMMVGGMFLVAYGYYEKITVTGEAIFGRVGAYGMYENSNDYTFIIVQILPFLYMYWRSDINVIRRGFLGISIIACIIGVFLSLSRGGMLALVLECVLIILLGMRSRRRLLLLPIFAILGAAAISYQYAGRAAIDGDSYTADDSANGRYELWRTAGKMLKDKPFLGVGSRRFAEYSKQYDEGLSGNLRGRNTHNTYLEILATNGLVGFACFALMLYNLLRVLLRKPQKQGPPWLEATRTAALIGLISIIFRAFFDAKQFDWSFYILCNIGITCSLLQRQIDASAQDAVRESGTPGAKMQRTQTALHVANRS